MLKISNVSKRYGDNLILDDISFAIDESKIVGLAGPSGGGKSTLLRCIQNLETIDTGSIVCDGRICFMFQDFQLFPHMTVLDNLLYAPKLIEPNKNHEQYAKKILTNLGILSKLNAYPNQLSGGQKQRVALARSLMIHPELLLCDEPTSGLDVATIFEVVGLLQSVRELGVTMMIASHDLDFLTRITDQILLLKDGKILTSIYTKTTSEPIKKLKKYY
ncbi:MAG: amino acid ABC transporter ATP-binding protein [Legionellales bacterium]|nr:amino acid ABC transporter ATP-binding protein [Legionellales bacterium]